MKFGKQKVYTKEENEKIFEEIMSGKRKGINERSIKAAIESGLITKEMIFGIAEKAQKKKMGVKELAEKVEDVSNAKKESL